MLNLGIINLVSLIFSQFLGCPPHVRYFLALKHGWEGNNGLMECVVWTDNMICHSLSLFISAYHNVFEFWNIAFVCLMSGFQIETGRVKQHVALKFIWSFLILAWFLRYGGAEEDRLWICWLSGANKAACHTIT